MISCVICSLTIGFTTSWKLSLVILGCAPFLAVSIAVIMTVVNTSEAATSKAYAKAGEYANEAFSSVRAVVANSGEARETQRYDHYCKTAMNAGISKGIKVGLGTGVVFFIIYAMYGIGCYAGARFIKESRDSNPSCVNSPDGAGCFSGGQVVQTFMSVFLAAASMGQLGQLLATIASAKVAAFNLFKIIDSVPSTTLDVENMGGLKPENVVCFLLSSFFANFVFF
jgi:ABC-type multidrug transport system fused ATPase/permease subunit